MLSLLICQFRRAEYTTEIDMYIINVTAKRSLININDYVSKNLVH